MYNVSAAEASTTAGTTNEKESENEMATTTQSSASSRLLRTNSETQTYGLLEGTQQPWPHTAHPDRQTGEHWSRAAKLP